MISVGSSVMSSPNPYASPRHAYDPLLITTSHIQPVVSLYRWIGVCGVVFYLGVGCVVALVAITGAASMSLAEALALTVGVMAYVAFFVVCFRTGRELALHTAGLHRRSRWIAIIMASLFFPILTVPALYCIRKLRSHYEQPPGALL